jgi:carboxyl-terminal processing protease
VPFATHARRQGRLHPAADVQRERSEEVEAAAAKLVNDGARGIVLDLRDNGGGIVDQSLAVSSLFLKARTADRERALAEHGGGSRARIGRSAGHAAADDRAHGRWQRVGERDRRGSLQDHDRALVVGTTSFGKGLVQSVFPLEGGYALKITTGKWYTPSGRSIHRERTLLPDGRFVEARPDSLETEAEKRARPKYSSDAGRTGLRGRRHHPRSDRSRRHAGHDGAGVPEVDRAEGAGVRDRAQSVRLRAEGIAAHLSP